MLVNTQVRQEEDGKIPSPKDRELGNGQGYYLPLQPTINTNRIERRNRTECDFLGVLSDPHLLWAGWWTTDHPGSTELQKHHPG
jgi:hypothetical protein